MLIKTYGRTAEIHTPTRNEIVAVMNELTSIGRKRRNDDEYLATYAAAKDLATRWAKGKVEIRLERAATRLATAGRLRRARIALAIG